MLRIEAKSKSSLTTKAVAMSLLIGLVLPITSLSSAYATTSQSICFDNNQSVVSYIDADSADIAVGTGDYTFESWVKISAFDISHADPRNGHTGGGAVALMSTDGGVYGQQTHGMTLTVDGLPGGGNGYVGGNIGTTLSGGIPSNLWFHVAFVRTSGLTTSYLNGVSQSTINDAKDYSSARFRLASKIDQIFPFGFTGCVAGVGFYNSAKYSGDFSIAFPQPGVTPSGAVVYLNPTSANTIGDITNSGSGAAPAVTGSVTLSSSVPAPTLPTISGATTARSVSGSTITLVASATGVTGIPAPTLSYRWLKNGRVISGAVNQQYVVQNSDAGSTITVEITATNAEGIASATSIAADISVANVPPTGNRLYAVSCDSGANNGQIGLVNPLTGEIVNVGQGTTDTAASATHQGCAGGATFNSVNRLGYWFNWDSGKTQLFSVVPESGVSTYIGEVTTGIPDESGVSSSGHINVAQGIATDSYGNMYLFWANASGNTWYIGLIDKTTAVISGVKAIDSSGNTVFTGARPFYFTFNPVNSKFYAVPYGASWDLIEIDIATGATTSLGATGSPDNGFCGGPIDANGVMWSINWNVASVAFSDWTTANKVQYTTLDPIWYSEAMFLYTPIATVVAPAPSTENTNKAAEEAHQAKVADAKSELRNTIASGKPLSLEQLLKADISGVTAKNISAINLELSKLPEDKRGDIKEIEKIVFKFATVDKIAEHKAVASADLVSVGLIASDSKIKTSILLELRRQNPADIDSFEKIQEVIAAVEKKVSLRKAKLAALVSRKR